jgi:hypothetical protein
LIEDIVFRRSQTTRICNYYYLVWTTHDYCEETILWPFGIQIRIIDIKMVSFIKVTRCFHMNFIFFYKTIKEWKLMHRVYLNNVAWSMFPKHQKTYYVEIWFIFLKYCEPYIHFKLNCTPTAYQTFHMVKYFMTYKIKTEM